VVVVILLKLTLAHFCCVLILEEFKMTQIAEDGGIELTEAILVHLSPHRVNFKDELPRFSVVLVEGGSRADKLVEVHGLLAFEVDVVEYLESFLTRDLQLYCHFFDAEEFSLVAEQLEFVPEVPNLIVVET
jgi:hypothetical protein